jgi:hypothetical protein
MEFEMKQPRFCKDCKWSMPEKNSDWNLKCVHPKVMSKDAWALAHATSPGVSCRDERKVQWFPACGQTGHLFEVKP